MPDGRDRKLRQAAIVYVIVGVLYEGAVAGMAHLGLLPPNRGPVWVWLLFGAAIVATIFWGLWYKRSIWLARAVCVLQAFRLPALVRSAFFAEADPAIAPGFYMAAIVVVSISVWMMARAGWDL